MALLEVKKTADGRVLARRKDGQRLTPADRERACRMVITERFPADITEGRVTAVEICSEILQAHIWLAFDENFNPDDGRAVFYPDELSFLRGKDAATLRVIHEVKLKYGGGRVSQ